MIDQETKIKFRNTDRFKQVNMLMFHRSCSFAKTPGELFDILESIPKKYPVVWDDTERKWVEIKNILKPPKKRKL